MHIYIYANYDFVVFNNFYKIQAIYVQYIKFLLYNFEVLLWLPCRSMISRTTIVEVQKRDWLDRNKIFDVVWVSLFHHIS